MQRRSDRGEWGFVEGCFVIFLLAWTAATSIGLLYHVGGMRADIRRIADAVRAYAPPAEPVKEK